LKCPACQSENPRDNRTCHRCGSVIDPTSSQTITLSPTQEAVSSQGFKFNPGEKFGDRYTIIEEIARGGMGRVYKAKDHELGITVVLKMLPPELSSRSGMIDQFRKETLLGRSVSHENVVRIHDLGEVNNIRYISMDFIKGENLRELIQTSGSLTISTCLHIALQVCQALKAAHQKGIIHQDLKPQNIMIDNSGKVFVTDFGLAKSVSISEALHPGKISGTPKYFSPEQARGEESDQRSDIYSLGVILYEMVSGSAPFKADTAEGYIHKHTSEKPPLPSKINPDIPPPCEKIILKCMEKRRENRYQTVDELLQDLETQKKHMPAKGIHFNKWLKTLMAAALIVLAGIALNELRKVILPERQARPPGQPFIAVMYAVNNSGDKSLGEQFRWSIQHYLSTFLAQSKYLRVLPPDRLMSILSDMKQLDEERHFSKTLDRISEILNVGYFILPSFTKAGDNFWISLTVRRAKTDETLGEPDTVKGKKVEDVLSMVEELSQKVKSRLDLSPQEIAGDYNQSLGEITTTSREALRHYIDGEKYYVQRDYAASIKALESAVREDPNFAMAYLKMADNYDYLGDYDNNRAYLQKALTLIDRVSARDRYIIQGYYSYTLEESPLKAIWSYQKLIELYPHDEEGRTLLGAIHRNYEEWDLALEQFDQILTLNPTNALALENKVFIYTAKGMYEKAIELCSVGPSSVLEGGFFVRQLPLLHLIQGKYDGAFAELEKALARLPGNIKILEIEGNFHHLKGDGPSARRLYEQVQRSGEAIPRTPDFWGRIWLTCLLMQQGEYRQAQKRILEGIELTQKNRWIYDEINLRLQLSYSELQIGRFSRAAEALKQVFDLARKTNDTKSQKKALHLSGLASLGMGQIEEAKRISRQLLLPDEKASFPNQIRRHDHLMGHIALAEGRPEQAVRLFEHAISLLPHQRETSDEQAFYDDSLAIAYDLNGNWPRALETYQRITSLTTGRLMWGDIYARSYYRLGKIYQRNGNNQAAAAHYENFLRLWKNADGGLPEVDDAKKQLEALKRVS
jgi:serine/threonine protein kinase/tetratricopeptide (TPR) repeat protein